MERRTFLKSVVAAVVAIALPVPRFISARLIKFTVRFARRGLTLLELSKRSDGSYSETVTMLNENNRILSDAKWEGISPIKMEDFGKNTVNHSGTNQAWFGADFGLKK